MNADIHELIRKDMDRNIALETLEILNKSGFTEDSTIEEWFWLTKKETKRKLKRLNNMLEVPIDHIPMRAKAIYRFVHEKINDPSDHLYQKIKLAVIYNMISDFPQSTEEFWRFYGR